MKTGDQAPMNPLPDKASKKKNNKDQKLHSDVAEFAASLGLGSSSSSFSGFNDVDFRKSGPIRAKPRKDSNSKPELEKDSKPKPQYGSKASVTDKAPRKAGKEQSFIENEKMPKHAPKRKHPPLPSLDDFGDNKGKFDKYKNLPPLPLVKASALGVWYEDAMELEMKVLGGEEERKKKLFEAAKLGVEGWKGVAEEKRKLGERLMRQYVQDFDKSKGQSGPIKMAVASQRSGSAVDKVSAFYVLVDENPIANLRSLDALLGMVTSKVGKRHALKAFEVLREIFITSLLPDRKLKTLLQQPLNSLTETKDSFSLLLFWYFEDCLKHRYERFVSALEEASRDMLPALKDKALKTIYVLLKSKQEQERRLLSALVNKLGDPQNKGASNADFHLSNLLTEHPNWKAVVIDEVDSFLFRPKLGSRAKYHAVNFLSQIRLSHHGNGSKLAKRLIDVYFAVFKVLITDANSNQKGSTAENNSARGPNTEARDNSSSNSHVEMDSRILSALLTGVNRAFPYVASAEADEVLEEQTPMLFKLVHSKNFNVGVQALMLLDKISSKNQIVSDRFYRALYSKLLLPSALNTSKAEMFIGLLLRAMKNDVNLKRVAAFSKRLLQVALQQPPQYACGCLFLLSEVLKARPPLWNMVLQNESVDEELEHFEDIMEDDSNEHDKTLKEEENNQPVKKSEKGMYRNNYSEDEQDDDDDEDEGNEGDESPTSSSDDDISEGEEKLILVDSSEKIQGPHQSSDNGNQPGKSSAFSKLPGGYDPRHREPSYCNADRASWWELQMLASHAHPSVATMAGTLLSGANIVYDGNPLNDLSLTAFLDKFMEKKPKQTTWHGGSQIEPAKKLEMNNHLIGPEILSLAESDVPPEDLVFHKFYMNKMNTTKPKKKKKKKGAEAEAADEFFGVDDDGEVDGGDESDNEEIENLLDTTDKEADPDEYNSNDLDDVGDEDDDDLVGNASDGPSDVDDGEDTVAMISDVEEEDDDDDGDDIKIGDEDDGDENDDDVEEDDERLNKRKVKRKSGASPFASLEDYEHLLKDNDDDDDAGLALEKKSKRRKRHHKRKH